MNKKNPVLVAFEGLDCSFKETNSKMLKKYLEDYGYSVELFSFPNYNKQSAYFVKEFLRNSAYRNKDKEYTFDEAYRRCIFYAIDRYDTYLKEIKPIMDSTDIIIFDRYCYSNFYNIAPLNLKLKYTYQNAIYALEHTTFELPVEDIDIFLNMPYNVSRKIRDHKSNKDLNEKDEEFLQIVYGYWSSFDTFYHDTKTKLYNININVFNKNQIDLKKCLAGDENELSKSRIAVFDKIKASGVIDMIEKHYREKNGKEK